MRIQDSSAPALPAGGSLVALSLAISLILCFALAGCFQVRPTTPALESPRQLVTRYLKDMFNPAVRKDLYDLLTPEARKAVPYRNFVSLRNNEVSYLAGRSSPSGTRVAVSVFEQYAFSDDHHVLYALLTISHPYSMGEREKYALVRLHCHRQEDRSWAIHPFIHPDSGTVILIPTRTRGPLWRISDDMEQIANLVRRDISTYQTEKQPPKEQAVAPESPEEMPLVIPDVLGDETLEVSPEPLAPQRKVDALLSIGKLCYEAGRIKAAEDTFRRVLALQPDNPVAEDYLSRCAKYRLLLKEKEEAARLIEELLEIESEERSPK
jgi:tetratricopeptide (TPR) repeat protein